LFDIGGSAYQLDTTKKKFMIFLSKDCGSCIELLPELQKINTVFCIDQNIDFLLLWENQIPTNDVQKFGLSEHSYSLDNVRISSTFDTVYYVNEKNEIQLVDNHGGFDNILRLITEDTLFDRTIRRVNKMLVENVKRTRINKKLFSVLAILMVSITIALTPLNASALCEGGCGAFWAKLQKYNMKSYKCPCSSCKVIIFESVHAGFGVCC